MFGHSRNARSIREGLKIATPLPPIKDPKGGRGRGGLDPLFTTDVQKTTRIFIILYSSGILILVG